MTLIYPFSKDSLSFCYVTDWGDNKILANQGTEDSEQGPEVNVEECGPLLNFALGIWKVKLSFSSDLSVYR